MKGESDKEIFGFAQVMRKHSLKVEPESGDLLDTCGTGGDGAGTFNISTGAALVAAAAGAKVAKHGNRSISSKCGSADVLEALGIKVDLGPGDVAASVDEVGFGFMFAPIFHGAMKYARGPRQEIGVRTVFNVLGPLTNPAGASFQLVGVYDEELTAPIARVLGRLGTKRALVVHGSGGIDEITLAGPTLISSLQDGKVKTNKYVPEDFGFSAIDPGELKGGDAHENANIIHGIISGSITGAKRDMVLANAGAALLAAGLADNYADGSRRAAEAVDSGAAGAFLNRLIDFTKSRGN